MLLIKQLFKIYNTNKRKKKVISLIFGAGLIWRTDFGSYE